MKKDRRGEHLKISEEFEDVKLSDEDAADSLLAREILQEIKKFGVSYGTCLKLIELLALELEDRNKMLDIIGAIKGTSIGAKSPIVSG